MSRRRRKQSPQPHETNPMSGEDAPPPERQFYSMAFVSQMIQQPPSFVRDLMRQAGVNFAYAENGVGLIRGDDLQRMAGYLQEARDQVEEVQGKAAAAPFN